MRRAAPLLVAIAAVAGCGDDGALTFSQRDVQQAFQGEQLPLERPNPHPDDAYVHLESSSGTVLVAVFPTVKKANEWAPLLHRPVGWGTLARPRPMHRAQNVVVFYDPGFTEASVEARVRRAIRALSAR